MHKLTVKIVSAFSALVGLCIGAAAQDRPEIEFTTQIGHAGSVRSVAISPNGRFALSGSADNTVKLWEMSSGLLIRTFSMTGFVTAVVFSPDGRSALTANCDESVARSAAFCDGSLINLWDISSGALIRRFSEQAGLVNSIAISPDGRLALLGNENDTLKLLDISSGNDVKTLLGHHFILSVAFSTDGRLALSGSGDGTLKLWEVSTGREIKTFTGHKSSVQAVAFSPDGGLVLSGSRDRTLRLWDALSGSEIREMTGHTDAVLSVAFSPDGRLALSGSSDNTLKLWEISSGRRIRSFNGHQLSVNSVEFSPDGRLALSGSVDNTLILWEPSSGRRLRNFSGLSSTVHSVAFSPSGRLALSSSGELFNSDVTLWDVSSGRAVRSFTAPTGIVNSLDFSPDEQRILAGGTDTTVRLWDVLSGHEVQKFFGHTEAVTSARFSTNGRTVLSGSWDKTMKLWNVSTGREIRTFAGHSGPVASITFSPDGHSALSGSWDNTLKLWDVLSGREIRAFSGHTGSVNSIAFSPNGRLALSGGWDKTVKLWDVASGHEISTFAGHAVLISSVTFSRDGELAISAGGESFEARGEIKIWEISSGRQIRTLAKSPGNVRSIAISPNNKTILSGGSEGAIRLWNIQEGVEALRLLSWASDEWLTIAPSGFFNTLSHDSMPLHVVRGLEVTTIDQVHQSLFDPDLVREGLAGDPNGEVKRAAEVINMAKVLDSGPAPQVAISVPPEGSEVATDVLTVKAHIADGGKGVGRVEWRVNGITTAVGSKPAGEGPEYTATQQLALDPGENIIEVVAYNGPNLLASVPARRTVKLKHGTTAGKGRLHVLAIGIDAYDDVKFQRLKLAVNDAKAIGAALKTSAGDIYDGSPRIEYALDADATPERLDHLVDHMAKDIGPRDTFVLFAAAHGTSNNGRFYLIPYGFKSNAPGKLDDRAIGQDKLQDWIANRIKARKALILLDTCASGALVGGHTLSRVDAPASEAAVGRLHEATGRPILTAAASGQAALEGYQGHGVFTWALLDALKHGDLNGNGSIEISELAAHVQALTPDRSQDLRSKPESLQAVRGALVKSQSSVEPRIASYRQSARLGSRGEDFSLAKKLP